MKKYLSIIVAAAAVLSMAGCSSSGVNGPTPEKPAESDSVSGVKPASGGDIGSSGTSSVPTGTDEAYSYTDIGGVGPVSDINGIDYDGGMAICEDTACELDGAVAFDKAGATGGTAAAATDGTEDIVIGIPDDYMPEAPEVEPQAGLLTGGEWNDNAHWADWNNLYNTHEDWNQYRNDWKQTNTERLVVTVTTKDGTPLDGAKVTSSDTTSAVTDNTGKAYVFHKSTDNPINLSVTYGDKSETVTADGLSEISCEIDAAPLSGKTLDLMIMCDTTGSMGDELEYLKAELSDIVTKIKTDNANIPTRISVNFYRDTDDEYEVRQFPFSDNLDEVVKGLAEQSADGGGDFPEAVHTALDSAVNNHDWDENSVKIMFLVLDAPPHEDSQIIDSVNKYVAKAAEMGIRIVPIASSGIDKSTEYLLRTMAFTTGGTYTFLTDDSGIGGGHIEPTVGAFNVEKLNDMMVRIVNSYLK